MNGTFYGVSVGPGDPGLITVRALNIIRDCEVIAAPRTGGGMLALSIAEQAADMTGKTIVPLDFPMKPDTAERKENHRRMAETLAAHLKGGKDAAMLTIGDVSMYSSCAYIAAELAEMGFKTKMCPGVPSFCAAAAELNIPLSEGSEPVTVIPAQSENAPELIRLPGVKVIMKSGKRLAGIKDMLPENCAVYAVENCGLPGQKLYHSIDEMSDCGYLTVLIVKTS